MTIHQACIQPGSVFYFRSPIGRHKLWCYGFVYVDDRGGQYLESEPQQDAEISVARPLLLVSRMTLVQASGVDEAWCVLDGLLGACLIYGPKPEDIVVLT